MKILSYHPFSLNANGGGSRILRRLYEGHEHDVETIIVSESIVKSARGKVKETVVHANPVIRPWARWRIRNLLIWLRVGAFKPNTIKKIRKAAAKINYDVLHVVNHYIFSAALCDEEFTRGKKLWVSFHDHYNEIKSPVADTRKLWAAAHRRLVISHELGQKYQLEFGQRPYEIITDGVTKTEINRDIRKRSPLITIYFAGLLHITYLPLFDALAKALDVLNKQGLSFKLILRGTQQLKFLQNRAFETIYRPMTLDQKELKAELDEADILYLPIKFTSPDFYLYSLSTKMVGYLASPGAILYHGPGDSAACSLLQQHDAAVCCTGLTADDLANDIRQCLTAAEEISAAAKVLVANRFDLEAIRERFWMGAV
ncbi:glycosyltransferase family protein [Mucilaginibacter glaciei]|uniref:Uncharacterized protein n=1 Tax=Mucilaginibacter glaciei TaxID=2772109 RepID=A0A926NP26_9SPHI|nr:hypothetical protein [Mucilaginibacter glaciei]MBD1393301.1 hypothetical protein [Mucilaginibacter glaciei]